MSRTYHKLKAIESFRTFRKGCLENARMWKVQIEACDRVQLPQELLEAKRSESQAKFRYWIESAREQHKVVLRLRRELSKQLSMHDSLPIGGGTASVTRIQRELKTELVVRLACVPRRWPDCERGALAGSIFTLAIVFITELWVRAGGL